MMSWGATNEAEYGPGKLARSCRAARLFSRIRRTVLWGSAALGLAASVARVAADPPTPAASNPQPPATFTQFCAACHGERGAGGQGPGLIVGIWPHGGDDASLVASIRHGYPEAGMPAFAGTLSDAQIQEIIQWLKSQRLFGARLATGSQMFTKPLGLPDGPIQTERETFRIERLAKIDRPSAMAFLPDGRLLITEHTSALRIYQNGKLLPGPVADTPRHQPAQDSFRRTMLDVAVHANGWIYLTHGGRMTDGTSAIILSRGHIVDHRWVDSQDLLRMPSAEIAGGKIAIDRAGYLFTAVNGPPMPETAAPEQEGPQQLNSLSGKILRLAPDGSPPPDNPFVGTKGANPYIWSIGHRSVMGMTWDDKGRMLESENGPRGGDELNIVVKGRNYGWPVITWGHRYDERLVASHTDQPGMEQPVISWVPSPAVSATLFYTGRAFPGWNNSLLLGSLKMRNLYRIVLQGEHAAVVETLLFNADRVRDLKTGPDGLIYMLTDSGDLVRLVPAKRRLAR